MSTFEVLVLPIDSVYDHPNADRLSICRIRGYEAITNKDENGNHRFAAGELIVYVPENAVIPLDVLKDRGYCNENGQGMLAGSQGNRVRAIRLRGVVSQGLVWKVKTDGDRHWVEHPNQTQQDVVAYDNVVEFFDIQKYEEPIPSSMSGQLFACHKAQFSYDIENWQTYPEFLVNDEVEVLEKIHGSFCRISYIPGLNNPEAFANGDVVISSKGLGAKGLVFKNVEENIQSNLYVRTVLDSGFIQRMITHCDRTFAGAPVHIMGEVFGRGVQDLHYGAQKPIFRAFDMAVLFNGNVSYMDTDRKIANFAALGIERPPALYRGPWDLEVLTQLRDGVTLVGGGNIREGIVITSTGVQDKRMADEKHALRPILKMVSPAYLTRKGGTELQ
jgi:RNA ligase (TIGR02306 family)